MLGCEPRAANRLFKALLSTSLRFLFSFVVRVGCHCGPPGEVGDNDIKRRPYRVGDMPSKPFRHCLRVDHTVAQFHRENRVAAEVATKAAQFCTIERGEWVGAFGTRTNFGGLSGLRDRVKTVLKTAHGAADRRARAAYIAKQRFLVAVDESLERQLDRHVGELRRVVGIATHQVIEHGGIRDGLCKRERIERVLERFTLRMISVLMRPPETSKVWRTPF